MPEPWLYCPRPNPAATIRLVCFPHAGGGASAFRAWPARFGADIEVTAVRLPGRENRFGEPRYHRMADLVTDLCAVLRTRIEPPYAFLGHSLGALVAYETACRLARSGGTAPSHLIVAASAAPQRRHRYPALHALAADELIERLRALGGMPAEILGDPELLAALLPMIRDDLEIADTYRPESVGDLECPVTALGGRADRTVDGADIDAWRQVTRGPAEAAMVPGDHFFIHQAESAIVAIIAASVIPVWPAAATPGP